MKVPVTCMEYAAHATKLAVVGGEMVRWGGGSVGEAGKQAVYCAISNGMQVVCL